MTDNYIKIKTKAVPHSIPHQDGWTLLIGASAMGQHLNIKTVTFFQTSTNSLHWYIINIAIQFYLINNIVVAQKVIKYDKFK